MKILVVSQDLSKISALNRLLNSWGYDPSVFHTCDEKLKDYLGRPEPSISLLDGELVAATGPSFWRSFPTKEPIHSSYYLVLIPKTWDDAFLEDTHFEKADDFIYWPIRSKELQARLEIFSKLTHLTEQVNDQNDRLLTASLMSNLGLATVGLAHEIKNPLCVILASSGMITQSATTESSESKIIRSACHRIEMTVQQIQGILHGLQGFTGGMKEEYFSLTHVSEIIDDLLAIYGSLFWERNVTFKVSQVPSSLTAKCHKAQILQVLVNLINNSMLAISQNEHLKEKWVHLTISDLGDRIEFAVIDSGPGVPKEIQTRIMEPFFTTWKQEQGTGLGLAISKNIIELHGSKLVLRNDSKNTCFSFELRKSMIGE